MSSDKFIEVNCLKCGDTHRYSLEVKRSLVLSYNTLDTRVKKRTFRRLLSCPKSGEDFEVVFELSQTPQTEIQSVKVLGIISKSGNDGEDGNEKS